MATVGVKGLILDTLQLRLHAVSKVTHWLTDRLVGKDHFPLLRLFVNSHRIRAFELSLTSYYRQQVGRTDTSFRLDSSLYGRSCRATSWLHGDLSKTQSCRMQWKVMSTSWRLAGNLLEQQQTVVQCNHVTGVETAGSVQ